MDQDREDYEGFLNGRIECFERIVLRYKDNLIFFLQRYIPDIYTCEDIAQEVFADIYISPGKYNFAYSLKTYIFTIGRNKAVDYIRHNGKIMYCEDMSYCNEESYRDDENMILEQVIRQEMASIIAEAIKSLKKEYQAVINLIDYEQMSYKEASIVLRQTMPQIKVNIHRARKALRRSLEGKGYVYEE